jgi:hypothetical protein
MVADAEPEGGGGAALAASNIAKWLGVDAGDVLPGAPTPISGMIRYQ